MFFFVETKVKEFTFGKKAMDLEHYKSMLPMPGLF